MHRLLYLALFIFAAAVFLVHYFVAGQAVYGDGIGYYAHLHSWVIDHDFDYTDEYEHHYSPENNNAQHPTSAPVVQIVSTTASGKAENKYSPGVAILLLPFYLAAHLLKHGTGYEDIYQILTGLGAVAYTVLGLYFLDQLVKNKWVVLTIFLATQLLYYGSFDVINSHFASFFLTVLFFFILFSKKLTLKVNLLLGLIAGLLFSTRMQDGVVLLIWLLWPQNHKPQKVWWLAIGFILACLPMLYQWHMVFSDIWQHSYLRELRSDTERHIPIDLWGSWFKPATGLFAKAPILLVLLVFWLTNIRKISDRKIWLTALFFLIQCIVIAVQRGWTASAYGGRMYTSSLIFFALILKIFIQKIRLAKLFCLIFIGISFITFGHFILFEKQTQEGGRGTENMTVQRLQGIIKLWPK